MTVDYKLVSTEDFPSPNYPRALLIGVAIALGFIIGFLARLVTHG